MSLDWSRYTLADLVRLLGTPDTSMVPEMQTIALYRALETQGWPGVFIDWYYLDPLDDDRLRRCSFLMQGEEAINAKGETPQQVIDGRYVSMAHWKDTTNRLVVPDDDPELDLSPGMSAAFVAPLVAKLEALALQQNTVDPPNARTGCRL